MGEDADIRNRLLSLLQFSVEDLEVIARYGCPVGGLCQELGKQGGALADQAAKLLHDLLSWCEAQFRSLGFGEKSADLALNLVSSIQGIYLLTHTFKDPKLSIRQAKLLQEWLEKLIAGVRSGTKQVVAEVA